MIKLTLKINLILFARTLKFQCQPILSSRQGIYIQLNIQIYKYERRALL